MFTPQSERRPGVKCSVYFLSTLLSASSSPTVLSDLGFSASAHRPILGHPRRTAGVLACCFHEKFEEKRTTTQKLLTVLVAIVKRTAGSHDDTHC